jgi:dolichol-phosphate mannosyltransferase
VLVSLATYNERDNLAPLLGEIHKVMPHAEILVVDDNSPDGTGRLADELAASDSRLHILHRAGKLGLGTAILTAMHYAMDHDFDYHINMDADFSHQPRYLNALLDGMDHHDVMIGSRYIPGGGSEGWPVSRLVISRSVNALVAFLMRLPAHDCSGAFRCYRVAKLREVQLHRILSHGYSFQQEVLYRCRKAGCRLGETPILFANRRAGQSKVNWYEAMRSIATILYIGILAFFGLDS